MFNISDDEMMSCGIKVIDGIAGSAKSSGIDRFFRERDMSYVRLTSTNRLKRDAMDRYNMDVKTIAAGLFTNKGTKFYDEEKDPTSKYIVIDEILQTTPKAIEWCLNHADTTDIIITTDSKQLLAPENEDAMMEAFTKLKMSNDIIYRNVTETLRPRNNKTKKLYNKLYGMADMPIRLNTEQIVSMFPNVIRYEEMDYNINDAYITHDNLTEDYLYKDKELMSNRALDLIPKGFLASKTPKDLTKYPIMSQIEAQRTHTLAYVQVTNVGSAVRFQGSEVTDMQKLYFILQPTSIVSSRELYTVVTRMWDIDSLVIVIADTPDTHLLNTFHGLPVKTEKKLCIDEEGNTIPLSAKDMNKLLTKYDTDKIYYNRDEVLGKGGAVRYKNEAFKTEGQAKRKSSAASLIKRDGSLNYSYMEQVYSILDAHDIDHINHVYMKSNHDKAPYELDVFSAHPTMMKFEKMPADGIIKDDCPHDDMLNFYLYRGSVFRDNSMITDDMKNYIESHNLGECIYLFSTPYVTGCYPGDFLYKKAHDTIESKKEIKDIHYGYYQKPYLRLSYDRDCYVRNEAHRYELFICAVFSQLCYYMYRLYDELKGKTIIVDAVSFECYNDDTVEKVREILPDYIDFRIRKVETVGASITTTTIYQTYSNLPTKEEKKRKQEAEKKRRYRAKKRAEEERRLENEQEQ